MDQWAVLKSDEWGGLEVYSQLSTQAEANKEAKEARKQDSDDDCRYFVAHLLSEARQNKEPILIIPLVKPRPVVKKTKGKKK